MLTLSIGPSYDGAAPSSGGILPGAGVQSLLAPEGGRGAASSAAPLAGQATLRPLTRIVPLIPAGKNAPAATELADA